jgi:hypothetical protein
MKVTVNIRELFEANASTYNGTLQVNATVDLDELLDNFPEEEDIDIDIHELLASHQQIAHIWGTEDVQKVRPDLSDEQAWEVLQYVDCRKDAKWGITWLTLEMAAGHLFGNAPTTTSKEA